MNEDVIGVTITLCVTAVLVPLALVHGLHKAQEVQESWRKLAERHRLHFAAGARVAYNTTVTGKVARRRFLLQKGGSGNNASFYMELQLNGELPLGLRLKSLGEPSGEGEGHATPVAEADERTGQMSINGEVRVLCTDISELPAYLTRARQRAVLRLVDVGGEITAGNKLRVTVSQQVDDLEYLDNALTTLAAVAPVLDVA